MRRAEDMPNLSLLKASLRSDVPPFYAMELMREAGELAAAGREVFLMCVGQPSVGAPERVRQAAITAMERSVLGYTDSFGILPLRQRISDYYKARYGVDVPVERIAVTTGSSSAFLLAFLAGFDVGDRVAIARPGYPPYTAIQKALGLQAVHVDVNESTGYHIVADHLDSLAAASGGLQGLMVASPGNPTGSMLAPEQLEALITKAEGLGVRVISDEIYHGITFGKREETALRYTDEAIVINSFSKYFCMTGWRLGWMVLPPALIEPVYALAQSFFISPPTLSQEAAIAAFDCFDEFDAIRDGYARNREMLLEALPKMGITRFAPPDGAFYLYADMSDFTNDTALFCRRILHETGVATTPGIDFDTRDGGRFMRMSFARSGDEMTRAIERLGNFLRG
ncbi:pyridoxal phosphate-dependent aminotransferase [Govanella unica]|uniref:aspartate transaminase n=1 Tax=Govanella unica TaxID=2975056 RepID=A0A9X3TXL3_9PROT|nr:aminotransferase class I/II-fold pyridoxal phosphate-dependent enzyme [Govania unica]MDA5193538.1 aminotransferase class I/II-fold pyridoxal phosphate-dependent enzyme [Govania unica]